MKLFFLLVFFPLWLFSAEVLESPFNYEDTNYKVMQLLQKVTNQSFTKEEKTQGFDYRYSCKWYSPFTFDVYIGRYKKDSTNSIIRIEADETGEEKVFKTIFRKEIVEGAGSEVSAEPKEDTGNLTEAKLKKQEEIYKELQGKSHIFSQGLNIISPGFSVIYNAYRSPFYTRNDLYRNASLYFMVDLLLVGLAAAYVSNTTKSKSLQDDLFLKKGPKYGLLEGKAAGFLLGSLGLARLYRSFGAYEDTAAHNRMMELSYTFSF